VGQTEPVTKPVLQRAAVGGVVGHDPRTKSVLVFDTCESFGIDHCGLGP
jgi:hypothetical protein